MGQETLVSVIYIEREWKIRELWWLRGNLVLSTGFYFLKKINWKCVTMLPLLTLDSVDMSLCYSVLYIIVCFCNFKGELI